MFDDLTCIVPVGDNCVRCSTQYKYFIVLYCIVSPDDHTKLAYEVHIHIWTYQTDDHMRCMFSEPYQAEVMFIDDWLV